MIAFVAVCFLQAFFYYCYDNKSFGNGIMVLRIWLKAMKTRHFYNGLRSVILEKLVTAKEK